MIIITADDYGKNRRSTDNILECASKRRITSASVMVFMEDSDRAARLAEGAGMETGLHINLTMPFDGQGSSGTLRDHHDKVIAFLTRTKLGPLAYNPRLSGSFEYLFKTQEEEFVRLYGTRPDFYNGHHHAHLCANMLLGKVLPRGLRIRRTFTFDPGEKNFMNRFFRHLLNRALSRRYVSPDRFYGILPLPDQRRLGRIFDRAAREDVEIEVHPENPGELAYLIGRAFADLLATVPLGGFRELSPAMRSSGR